MAVNLSPIWGAGAQLLDNSGNVLTGGKIYTYAAGTTTPAVTYTSSNGITANSNPIILNSAGRVPYEIWLTDGIEYKFVLKDSNDVLIGTWDNLSGINSNLIAYTSQQEIQTATAGQTVFNLTTMQYQPATNNLSVFVDGVNQYGPGAQYAFVETDSDTVTFVSGLHVGASVKFTTASPVASAVVNAENVAYDPPFIDSVTTNVEDKLAQYVSVKDFGAVGDGVTDDTVAIQNAINAGLTSNFKEIYFPQGIYIVSSKITIAPYYDPSIYSGYWSSVGKDYVLNFGTAVIKSTAATGSTVFEVTVNNFPESRYNFTVKNGEFVSNNKPADWFKFVGGAYWCTIFDGCVVPSGQQATTFVRHYNTSLTAEPGMLTMKNLIVSADHVWLFDKSAGGLTYVDNFIFDNIYHFGQDDYGATIGLQLNCGINNAKISKIVQVGKGGIIGTGGTYFGGYLVYSTIKNCYSETKTSTYLINALLDKCTLESCNAAINDTSTQIVTWYYGQAYGCVFTSLHVTDVSLDGAKPYSRSGYHYYPVLQFLGTTASQSNVIFGYSQNEYRNAINARQGKGAVSAVPGVCDIQVLTRYVPNLTSISSTGFVQTGKSISAVQNLGDNFTLDVYLDGKSITSGSKTLAVELRIGSDVIAIGPDISSTTGQWSANAKVQFVSPTPGIYQVISNFGQSWSGSTVSVNSVGTTDAAPVYVNATDSIILGLNVKSISGDVQIGTADMKVYSFGIYDTEA